MNVFFDSKNLSMQWIETRLLFWGVKQKQISIQDVSTYRNSRLTSSKSLMLLSNKLFDIKPLREYIVNDKPYYIYRIDGLDPKMLRLGILYLDPNSVLFVHH